jgi:putative ABC transport system substrate-binding protein
MRRREVLLGALASAATAPIAAAQDKVWRLGYLTPGSAEVGGSGSIRAATLPVLAERGFVEGRNLMLVPRGAEGEVGRLPALARQIAEEHADIVIAVGLLATGAMVAASPRTPIVMSFAGEDPVEAGYARSFARPGNKVTGIFFRAVESDAKRLALLAEAMPRARRLGFLAGPALEPARAELLARTASQLGIELTVRTARGRADYAEAFAALKAAGAEGVLVQATTVFGVDAPIFAPLAASHGMATICEWDHMARQGCVIGFGPDLLALRRRTGDYVVRILKGTDPGELPIEQPDRFTLAVNLRAAAELGLKLPPSFLARADEVIE